jgi:hypothetical protein
MTLDRRDQNDQNADRETVFRVIVAPGKGAEPPAAVRLRQWLKLGLRGFGVRVEWGDATNATCAPSGHEDASGESELPTTPPDGATRQRGNGEGSI